MCLYRYEPIKVSYHPALFGVHRHCGSEDKMVFICHMTLQDLLVRSPTQVTILPSLEAMATVVVGI